MNDTELSPSTTHIQPIAIKKNIQAVDSMSYLQSFYPSWEAMGMGCSEIEWPFNGKGSVSRVTIGLRLSDEV